MTTSFVPVKLQVMPPEALERLRLRILAGDEQGEGKYLKPIGGEYGNLRAFRRALIESISDELARLHDSCVLEAYPTVLAVGPGQAIHKHVDSRIEKRNCALVYPLHPLNDYPPTVFWDSMEQVESHDVMGLADLPALANWQRLHSVHNTSSQLRFNFQVSFGEPFDEVLRLIKEDKLFRYPLL